MQWFNWQPLVERPLDIYEKMATWQIPHWPLPVSLAAFAFGSLGAIFMVGRRDKFFRELTKEKIRALELPPSVQHVGDVLAALQQRDPQFSADAVQQQAARLLPLVLAPPPLEQLPLTELSDAMVRRLLAQRALGATSAPPQVQIDQLRIVGAFAERTFDALHVLLEWHDGAAPKARRADVMVFVRRPQVSTRAHEPGRCPNCAAPYAGGALNLCTHCKAVLNSGEFGWVLTQHIDFDAYRGPWREFRGVEPLLARDAGFSPEVLEDRAALIFWRWAQARARAQDELLSRYADAQAQAQLAERRALLRQRGEREWLSEVVLHGADIVRIRPATDEGLDEVHVRMRWTGRFGAGPADWKDPRVQVTSHAIVFTLVRDAQLTSEVKRGISTDRCPSCWAALFAVEGDACTYCQAPFPPKPTEFVLRRAESWEAWLGTERQREELDALIDPYIPSFKFVEERERLLRAMAVLMTSDGQIARAERRLLHRSAEMWGIDTARVRAWLESPAELPPLDLEPGSWVARAFVEALITAAAIDGHVDSKERALVVRIAKELGVEPPSIHLLRSRAAQAPHAA